MVHLLVASLKVSPSAWALLAGALVAVSVNVFTAVSLDQGEANLWVTGLSVGTYLSAAGLLAWISVRLEDLRASTPDDSSLDRVLSAPGVLHHLGFLVLVSILFVVSASLFLFLI